MKLDFESAQERLVRARVERALYAAAERWANSYEGHVYTFAELEWKPKPNKKNKKKLIDRGSFWSLE